MEKQLSRAELSLARAQQRCSVVVSDDDLLCSDKASQHRSVADRSALLCPEHSAGFKSADEIHKLECLDEECEVWTVAYHDVSELCGLPGTAVCHDCNHCFIMDAEHGDH